MTTGNSTETCGGHSRLNVYRLGDAPRPSNETTTTSPTEPPATPTGTPTSITSEPEPTTEPAPTPTVKDPVGGWDFEGCYTETDNGRALSGKTFADDDMTLEDCAEFCDEFQLFGVEYGRECYCGNSLREGSVQADDEDECSFPCPGDRSSLCGAGMRLQLYRNSGFETPTSSVQSTPELVPTSPPDESSSSTSAPTSSPVTSDDGEDDVSSVPSTPTETTSTPEPTVYPGNSNFTYYSCVHEPSAGRLLEDQIHNNGTHMTPKLCLERCWEFNYAGVEYGRECWCGDELNFAGNEGATPGRNVTDSECNFLCPGNEDYFCGAGSRLSLYIKKELVGEEEEEKEGDD